MFACLTEAHAEKWFIADEILVKQSDLRAISRSPVLQRLIALTTDRTFSVERTWLYVKDTSQNFKRAINLISFTSLNTKKIDLLDLPNHETAENCVSKVLPIVLKSENIGSFWKLA